jgi:hypothetical protein
MLPVRLLLFLLSNFEIFGDNQSHPSALYSLYHEYHPDLNILLRHTINPAQVYLEIQLDTEQPFLSHIPSFLQYLDKGAVILILNNQCQRVVEEKFLYDRFFCMNLYGLLDETSEEGQVLDTIRTQFPAIIPAFVTFSSSHGLLLRNSEFLRQRSSLFYVRNEYRFSSKSLIEMFFSAGLSTSPPPSLYLLCACRL